MIAFFKLDLLLKQRNISKRQLTKGAGITSNIAVKISKNESMTTDSLNKICEYLKVGLSDIAEWIPDSEYENIRLEREEELSKAEESRKRRKEEKKREEEILRLEAQIAELRGKIETM